MPVDLRARELAKLVASYCVKVKPKEKIIISGAYEAIPFLVELYKEIILKGAYPIVKVGLPNTNDFFYKYAKEHQINFFPQYWLDTVKSCQAYIGIDAEENTRTLNSADPKKITTRDKVMKPIFDYILNERKKMRRVIVAFPCLAHAQEAEMSLTEYENFVYSSCLLINWKKLGKKIDKIKRRFKENSQVHLKGENVDLKFQVHGKKAQTDKGEENMPGGEIYMAPVRESLNGYIKFEYPSIYDGKEVSQIYLKFKDGKVVEYNSEKNKHLLKAVLETDVNASYIGELGIGCNPHIKRFTKNLLFDEKISGTIHLALGMAYKENGGGNDSAIHWDIVKDMKKAKIIVDGKIIQKNGKWRI